MIAPVLPSRWVIAPRDAVDDPDVFPFLAGQGFLEQKTPVWSTKTDVSVSGVQRSRALWSYPLWRFKVGYEVLRDAADRLELQRGGGCVNRFALGWIARAIAPTG